MLYYKLVQVLRNKNADCIGERILCYAACESLKDLEEEMRDFCYIYDILITYEKCSKYEYDNYHDIMIDYDYNNKILNQGDYL